jgi:hypothetical protein
LFGFDHGRVVVLSNPMRFRLHLAPGREGIAALAAPNPHLPGAKRHRAPSSPARAGEEVCGLG